uniref:Uncharacterized protein n=1 Tax=Arundo donax TaxID=35708 RepID=A0A0A8XSJ8_ARUDO
MRTMKFSYQVQNLWGLIMACFEGFRFKYRTPKS